MHELLLAGANGQDGQFNDLVCKLFEYLSHACASQTPWAGGSEHLRLAVELLKSKSVLAAWLRLPPRIFDRQIDVRAHDRHVTSLGPLHDAIFWGL